MFSENLAPVHEFRHAADDDPTYNESTYYNFTSPSSGVVGWLRVAIQPNQPAAQATALVFLPTGTTLFTYARVGEVPSDAFAVGPVTFEIDQPYVKQRLAFDGRLSVFTDGRVLTDPGKAIREAPTETAAVRLTITAMGAPFGTSGENQAEILDDTLALGHFEQFHKVVGDIKIGDRAFTVDGTGLRDHSWGPRDWSVSLYYRWITAALEDGSAIMGLEVARRDGTFVRRGAYCDGTSTTEAEVHQVSIDWTEDGFGERVETAMTIAGQRRDLVATAVRSEQFMPLRHRRQATDGSELLTRIGYAPYSFTCSDGRRGMGIVEILDQMIDGQPMGKRIAASQNGAVSQRG